MTTPANPTAAARADIPNDLEAFWLPFTPNRAFKKRPRLIARSKDMHYYTPEGREILDGTAALWCCNAGHNRKPIVEAIQRQAAELDFSPTFGFAHPPAFQLASRIADLAPADLDHVFFCNSGSEACDSALKIALAYHNVRGQGRAPASSAASAPITASASAAFPSAASSTTANSSVRCWPASTTCRRPTTASIRPSPRASRNGAAISPTRSRGSSPCTTPRPSPP